MKRIVLCAVAFSVILCASNAFAGSKKYYEFKLKARPASGWMAQFGDHTYTCIKKLKKKKGKYRTVRNYGCYANFGTTHGGSTRGRWIIKRNSSGKKGKRGALCTQSHGACRMRYLIHGVCHQETNRMLHGGHGILRNVYGDDEGFNSYRYFGSHGRGWDMCRHVCY